MPLTLPKMIILTLIEISVLMYIFIRWYTETFVINKSKVVHTQGLIFRRLLTFNLNSGNQIATQQSLFGRILGYQTLSLITLKPSGTLNMTDITNLDKDTILSTLKRVPVSANQLKYTDINKLLKQPESEQLEFKSSLRWDNKNKKINRLLEKSVIKNLAAFLNTKGGVLLIGVGDNGEIKGIQEDLDCLPKANQDSFENHLTQIFSQAIGAQYRQYLSVTFHEIDSKLICQIRISPAKEPVFITFNGMEHFYIKTGNSTASLPISKALAFIKNRFKSK